MFDINTLVRPNIRTLEPYRCARDDFKVGVLLDANENTHGPALQSQSQKEQNLQLNRYPDPHQVELKKQIVDYRNSKPNSHLASADGPNGGSKNSGHSDNSDNSGLSGHRLSPDNLCLGVGSDESIDMLMRCVCVPGKDKLVMCPPTYGMYSICATINDVVVETVPLLYPEFQVDVPELVSKVSNDSAVKLIYITSPGNPTGKLVKVDDVVALLTQLAGCWNGLVVVDEAYIDFTDPSQSMCTLVNQYPNLVVLQTLSKSFGLAGIRLGVTYCCVELSRYLNSMKYPYSISSLTSDVAIRATNEEGLATMQKYVDSIVVQRRQLLDKLQKVPGIGRNIGGLDANFLLVEIVDNQGVPSNDIAKQLYTNLAVDNAVVVRFRGTEMNCTGALRISIGTEEENAVLLEKLQKCLEELLRAT
jgi:histidinol-phosphate aminotransferase